MDLIWDLHRRTTLSKGCKPPSPTVFHAAHGAHVLCTEHGISRGCRICFEFIITSRRTDRDTKYCHGRPCSLPTTSPTPRDNGGHRFGPCSDAELKFRGGARFSLLFVICVGPLCFANTFLKH